MLNKNIDAAGRWLRALMGVSLLAVAGILFHWGHLWMAGLVAAGGCFALFEAAFGWCAARACGIKTRL